MKKIFSLLSMCLVAVSSFMVTSCKDEDSAASGTDRQFMTMFITDQTADVKVGQKGCSGIDRQFPHGNSVHLYWYGVNNCAGYQIQMSLQSKVANGPEAWAKVQGTPDLLLDTIVGPDEYDLVLENLSYSTNYRFAIRVLSKQDNNVTDFSHASNWYGHGNGRQWQEYFGVTTDDRYETPYAVYVDQSKTTETTMHVMINSNVKDFIKVFEGMDDATMNVINALNPISEQKVLDAFPKITDADRTKLESYFNNFNVAGDGTFGFKYLQVQPSPSNPNSTVGAKWKKYEITDADREKGYIDIDGLTANSVYVIDVIDPTKEIAIDAKYNTCTTRSDGTPGEPILLKHDDMISTYANGVLPNDAENTKRVDAFALADKYNAAPISNVLYDFISDTKYAEGQTFLLEGGKTYYLDGNDVTCKGFVLRTDPADVAKGLRAKVICGIGKHARYNQGTDGEQWNGGPYSTFVFGRSPEAGEGGEIYMKKLAFYDIDFDNPTAFNYGDENAKVGKATGNYFFNMFSDGMAITLDSLVIENCTFKRLVRGFIREQGPNYKVWKHVVIKGNQFFDCGYYNNGAGGYCWIDGASNNEKTNMYADMKVVNNTFYDSPFPAFFNEGKRDGSIGTGGPWMITFSNNTLVNFNTRADGSVFKMRYLPDGSVFNVENNLLVLCKQSGDTRVLSFWGCDIREVMTKSDETYAHVRLNFNNNWSTNDNLTGGSIFSANPWSTEKNGFGTLVKNQVATLNGSLDVKVANISSTDLFTSPCPPYKATSSADMNMHRADALDGTASQFNVNLYIKNTDNDIVKNNVGDPRWLKK